MESGEPPRDGLGGDAAGQHRGRIRRHRIRARRGGLRRGRLPRLLHDLLGRFDEQLVAILVGQIDATLRGAELARRMTTGELPSEDARERMREIEHHGDQKRGELIAALASALTTPIDREDLFRFSRMVDDVLDGLRDFVRETDLYRLAGQESVTPVLDAVIEGLQTLRQATEEIVRRPQDAGLTTVSAKRRRIKSAACTLWSWPNCSISPSMLRR
nr:DUF47 family protein [Acidothermus cellulolyticus]